MKITGTVLLAGLLIAGTAWTNEGHESQAKQTEQTKIVPQTTCPVMGGKINKDLFIDHEGKRIYVCCKSCIAEVKKNPEKYIKKLADKGEAPVSVPEQPKREEIKPRGDDAGHEGHQH